MRRKKLKTLKRSILVHREQLIMCKRIICLSVKHVSLCSQTVELVPLCFCTCNKDLFCMKSFLVSFVKPFHSFKLKSVLYSYCQQNRFSMFVLHPGCFLCIECLILKFYSK